ncbi:YdcF family protein [Thiomonas sp. FB-6]|uniref:YdcF family protein n=1 Tax=Thiomonas sp. FB-6 TaxID=1158291 RepID=UPI0003A2AA58|nr:YdcF family protein [Thiomonas sp. FB-6]
MDFLASPFSWIGWALLGLALGSLTSRTSRRLRLACWAVLLLYWVVGSPWAANLALRGLESQARRLAASCGPPPDGAMVVVLAGGLHVDVADPAAVGSLSGESLRRLIAGVRVAKAVPGSELLISGGNGSTEREADLMAQLARRLGFPATRILVERESRTTWGSARAVARMLRGAGRRPIYLVTSAYHMPRAVFSFHRAGLGVCALPQDFQAVDDGSWDMLIPSRGALRKMEFALHEYFGSVYYRWVLLR